MIYTVTFNPAVDYVVHSQSELTVGEVNRVFGEEIHYGGKGINVSSVLNELEAENTALGFLAGFTGAALLAGITESGINSDFIMLEEESEITRINVKVKGKLETDINADGPRISQGDLKRLFLKLMLLKDGDLLVLAGSIPKSLPNDIYERILAVVRGKKVETVVDATGELLKKVLKYEPFLIKPNVSELSEIVGRKLGSEEEIFLAAQELKGMGAKNVLVSRGRAGAVLLDENLVRYTIGAGEGKAVNSVGAGDSMVAGFIAGYTKTGDYKIALRLGAAAGAATALSVSLAKREKIMEMYNTL